MYPALSKAVEWCKANGVSIPDDLARDYAALKALQDYDNILNRLMAIFMNDFGVRGNLSALNAFEFDMKDAVTTGLTEAWRLGMRENGADEITEEWQVELDGIIESELSHLSEFAIYLTELAKEVTPIGDAIIQARERLSLWINRYNDVTNQAILASAEEKTKMEWIYGDTQHCTTCEQLNGIVAYAREWEEAGLSPQSPPNPLLECGGWKCQCQLIPTDKRKTRNSAERLIAIAEGAE